MLLRTGAALLTRSAATSPFTRIPPGSMGLVAEAILCRRYSDKSSFKTDGEKLIYDKLHRELAPSKLTVKDASGGCGSMYVVEIEAECFRGKNRVNQTKMVNSLLKEELKDMHGMRVLCSVPPE
ncbi:hypothetical protein J3B02_001711 [Coemansia erecta]|uniref:BolA-like protein 3 n=1 Tax=Coemansia asiatica TaxID=1052880 RepID=A0A9W8CIL0_9FUNG|nr:hypothetical protein LPJ64_003624 [Coemansia asiatica]KAJ2856241.1 hypothetical protein J3B02_001711 [Coemansia erecta]KAJ2865253.1 hypothetical protein FB639_005126 [Coemansia asiatica]